MEPSFGTILGITAIVIIGIIIIVAMTSNKNPKVSSDEQALRDFLRPPLREITKNNNARYDPKIYDPGPSDETPAQSMQESQVACPKCNSTQITADRKGYGWGKAVGGGVLLGPIGLLGGFVGSRKVLITCLKCGHQWKP